MNLQQRRNDHLSSTWNFTSLFVEADKHEMGKKIINTKKRGKMVKANICDANPNKNPRLIVNCIYANDNRSLLSFTSALPTMEI